MEDLIAELDRSAEAGRRISFWLRDDDAVAPTPALDRLIALTERWDVPVVLAVVPFPASRALAVRLADIGRMKVAAHGFAHRNHAGADEKKQELGSHRQAATILGELELGLDRLSDMFGAQVLPMLVPPWNRISADLVPHLPGLGLRWLSAFGKDLPHQPSPGLVQIDCQLDIMDWRARRSHPRDLLADRLAALVHERGPASAPIGILTHHLVHDEAAWAFLDELFRSTARHPAVTWTWPVSEFGG
jgi:hypothetical protein